MAHKMHRSMVFVLLCTDLLEHGLSRPVQFVSGLLDNCGLASRVEVEQNDM